MTVNMSESSEHMDPEEHERTYRLFIVLVKYGTVAVVLILALMALFLL